MPSSACTKVIHTSLEWQERARRNRNSVVWFRGERDARWELRSTLHRYVLTAANMIKHGSPTPELLKKWLRQAPTSVYARFRNEAWPLLNEAERNDWGVVFAMQHFSLPTRLLDWTESLACAIFFAQLERQPEDTAAIWMLEPTYLNGLDRVITTDASLPPTLGPDAAEPTLRWHPRIELSAEEELETIAVWPAYTNPRMVQQRARFVVMGDSFLPLDQQWNGELERSGRIAKLLLPPETFDEAHEFLRVNGVDAFTFFPDLQGLALTHKMRVEDDSRFLQTRYPDFVRSL